MSKDTLRQIAVILSTTGTIIMNILANALPLNGQNTGEISDRFKVFFVPAGYVFSIWGLIYIGMIAYTIFQALPAQKANPRMRATGWLFALSGVANTAWLFFWHYNLFTLTMVAMLSLAGLLVAIFLKLGIGRTNVSRGERWSAHIPVSVYLGWISVATIANITDVLNYLGWNGGPIQPEVWAVILLGAVVLITAAMLYTRHSVAYALVIVWAAIGIAVKQANVPLVPTAAWVTAMLVALMAVITMLRPVIRRSITAAA
jgi:hypothetical protein